MGSGGGSRVIFTSLFLGIQLFVFNAGTPSLGWASDKPFLHLVPPPPPESSESNQPNKSADQSENEKRPGKFSEFCARVFGKLRRPASSNTPFSENEGVNSGAKTGDIVKKLSLISNIPSRFASKRSSLYETDAIYLKNKGDEPLLGTIIETRKNGDLVLRRKVDQSLVDILILKDDINPEIIRSPLHVTEDFETISPTEIVTVQDRSGNVFVGKASKFKTLPEEKNEEKNPPSSKVSVFVTIENEEKKWNPLYRHPDIQIRDMNGDDIRILVRKGKAIPELMGLKPTDLVTLEYGKPGKKETLYGYIKEFKPSGEIIFQDNSNGHALPVSRLLNPEFVNPKKVLQGEVRQEPLNLNSYSGLLYWNENKKTLRTSTATLAAYGPLQFIEYHDEGKRESVNARIIDLWVDEEDQCHVRVIPMNPENSISLPPLELNFREVLSAFPSRGTQDLYESRSSEVRHLIRDYFKESDGKVPSVLPSLYSFDFSTKKKIPLRGPRSKAFLDFAGVRAGLDLAEWVSSFYILSLKSLGETNPKLVNETEWQINEDGTIFVLNFSEMIQSGPKFVSSENSLAKGSFLYHDGKLYLVIKKDSDENYDQYFFNIAPRVQKAFQAATGNHLPVIKTPSSENNPPPTPPVQPIKNWD